MTSNKKRPSGPPLRLQAARGCKPATPTKATPAVTMPNIQRLLPLPTKDLDCVYSLHKFDRLANRGDIADSPPKIRKRQCPGEGAASGDERFFSAQAAGMKRCRTAIILVPRDTDLVASQLQQSDVTRGLGAAAAAALGSTVASDMKPSVACHKQTEIPAAQQLCPVDDAKPLLELSCSLSFSESVSASPASPVPSGCDEDRLSTASCGDASGGGGTGGGSCCGSPSEVARSPLLACGRDSVVSLSSSSTEASDSASCSTNGRSSGDCLGSEDTLSSASQQSAVGRGQSSACKWQGCPEVVGESALLRHLQETHLRWQPTCRRLSHPQSHPLPLPPSSCSASSSAVDPPSTALASCQWLGCKVFGHESRSRAWLEGHVLHKHVPGSKPFCCIVAGCDKRFSSQPLLARHVATHFDFRSPATATGTEVAAPVAAPGMAASSQHPRTRPTCEASGSGAATPKPKKLRKLLKGLQPCIRKTEDYIDPSVFDQMQEKLSEVGEFWEQFFTPEEDAIRFQSEVIGQRTDASGCRQLLLHYHPPDVISDCWVAEKSLAEHRTRTVSIDRLQQLLQESASFASPVTHSRRKTVCGQLRRVR